MRLFKSAETIGWDGLSFVSASLEIARWQASSHNLFHGSAVNGLDKNCLNSSSYTITGSLIETSYLTFCSNSMMTECRCV